MGGLTGRRIRRLAIALAAVAVVFATAGGGAARASSTGWPIDNLGQPVQRALSTYQSIGGGGAAASASPNISTSPNTSASPNISTTPKTSSTPSSGIGAGAAVGAAGTAGTAAGTAGAGGDGTSQGAGAATVVGVTPSGDPQAYFLNMGNYSDQTAEFVAVDLRTEKTVLDTRLPSGYSVTGMAYSQADNAVFMGTGEGPDLYEYQTGGTKVVDLGPSISGQTIWTLAAASDGTIWGGTYPGGDIFSYNPATQSFRNYGQALSGETYVTALLPTATTVYFGTQPDTDLGALDPGTGAVTQIPLPAAYAGQAGKVGGLSMAGSRLFVAIEANFSGALVWDTASQSWVATINGFSSNAVSPPDPANPDEVYYRGSTGNIVRYDIATLTGQNLSWRPNAIPGAWAWVSLDNPSYPGQTLMFTYYMNDRIYGRNFTSNASYYVQPHVQGSGDQLITLGEGPDGNVYAGAYLTPPGMGQWNPDRKSWQVLSGSGQVEGYGSYNGNLVFGRYPQGDLYYDNLSKPWGSGNPGSPVAIGDDQNRPVAFAEINGLEAVGSVPVSGRLGGDISLWNPLTRGISVYSHPIPDQTPVSLVAYDGLLWGGTSVDGGYGITPTAKSAELFAWSPVTHQVVFSVVPLQGAVNVSGLALDGQGHLWALADSTLVEFDLAKMHIMRREALSGETDGSMYGLEHQLVFDHGRLFATTDEKLFHIDTVTWQAQTLYQGPASNLTQDRYGQLYFVQEPSYVYRYDLPTTVYVPSVAASVTPDGGRNVVTLQASEPGGVGISDIDYEIGNGEWHTYDGPVTVAGPQTVSYRAVDNAWSPSPIGQVTVTPNG